MIGYCEDVMYLRHRYSKKEYLSNKYTQYTFSTPLSQIGEHAKRIDVWLENHYRYEWSNVIRSRDLIDHHYSSVDFEILWGIIDNDIPELYDILKELYDKVDALPDEDFRTITGRRVTESKPRKRIWNHFQRNKY